jgi:hypothetical protein
MAISRKAGLTASSRIAILLQFGFQLALLSSAAAQERITIEARKTASGTSLPVVQGRVLIPAREPFFVIYAVVDLRKYKLTIAVPTADNFGGASLERIFQDNKALAIINASFLESFTPALPAGLLIAKKKLLNEFKLNDPILSAVLCFRIVKGTIADIIPAADLEQPTIRSAMLAKYADCAQVGPLLALNGKQIADLRGIDSNKLSPNHASRSVERAFFGKIGEKLIFGVTSPTSLDAVREFGTTPENNGGLGLQTLVGLSARSAAGFYVGGEQPAFGGNLRMLLPSAIIVLD